jgi:hypothetical protein
MLEGEDQRPVTPRPLAAVLRGRGCEVVHVPTDRGMFLLEVGDVAVRAWIARQDRVDHALHGVHVALELAVERAKELLAALAH